jgi:hypothetical protein
MAHVFAPLSPHLTSTEKAVACHTGQKESGVKKSIVEPAAKAQMASAGKFLLNCDVTRKYTGPLTRKDAVGIKPERLPFIVYSTDILIEGCGWIELIAQVRRPKPQYSDALSGIDNDGKPIAEFPEVEVFSPKGQFIGQRSSLGAWLLNDRKSKVTNARKSRPRQSMVSVKKQRTPLN